VFALKNPVIKKTCNSFLISVVIVLVFSILPVAALMFAAWFNIQDAFFIPFIATVISICGVYFFCAVLIMKADYFSKWKFVKSFLAAILIITLTNILQDQVYNAKGFTAVFKDACGAVASADLPDFFMASDCAVRGIFGMILFHASIWLPPTVAIESFYFWRVQARNATPVK
jgi:hypothetical protein